jgi:DNA topoisomerase-3
MRLFIAEKPSLARAIAQALPEPHHRTKTHIRCGGGNVVAWCAGHILETAPPEAYRVHYKSWRMGDLPITPRDWKHAVSRPELLDAIRGLLQGAARVVHAGDPDREGQLLVDEVLDFLGYRGPVDRLLIRDLSPDAVRTQLAALEPNTKYRPLYESALARQRADWLYGMNMTRLYTLLGRAAGYDGVLSVGRVQTPVLGLIVARDRAIADFTPAPYYVVEATFRKQGAETFRAAWVPGPAAQPHLDEDKRLLVRGIAEAVRDRVHGRTGSITACTQAKRSETPPLPYSLADLQMEAGRRLGMSAQAVLDACQSLYETHRLTTYPRSDCAHLPEAHHAQAKDVAAAVARHAPSLAGAAAGTNLTLRSKAWNDKKISAHHAIIPTPSAEAAPAQLSDAERAIYELIARRYLTQFYPAHEYLQTKLTLDIAGETFAATGRQVLAAGWKALWADAPTGDVSSSDDAQKIERDGAPPLPPLAQGDPVAAVDIAVGDKKTQPPKHFTDASLIAAMCAVAKFVSSPHTKKILSETDGIGTPATRAAIIETLFERGYVTRDKRAIVSTETGRALIGCLPEVATTPDMTAVWEAAMRAITDGSHSLDAFLTRIGAELGVLVAQGRSLGRITVPPRPVPSAPRARAARPSRRPSRSPAKSPSLR